MGEFDGFPWRRGMHGLDTKGEGFTVVLVHPVDGAIVMRDRAVVSALPVSSEFMRLARPDLTDPATVGALAAAVREAFGTADLETCRGVDGYYIVDFAPENDPDEGRDWPTLRIDGTLAVNSKPEERGKNRGAAWLAAWNARPR